MGEREMTTSRLESPAQRGEATGGHGRPREATGTARMFPGFHFRIWKFVSFRVSRFFFALCPVYLVWNLLPWLPITVGRENRGRSGPHRLEYPQSVDRFCKAE